MQALLRYVISSVALMILGSFFFAVAPVSVYGAEETEVIQEVDGCNHGVDLVFSNPIKYCSVEELLLGVLDAIVTILIIPIVVFSIVYIGFKMVIAGTRGQSEEYKKLQKSFVFALAGLFIILAVKGILSLVKNTINEFLAFIGNGII